MEKFLSIVGVVCLLIALIIFMSAVIEGFRRAKHKSLGQLYFKDWPDGNRTYRINLETDLSELKEDQHYDLVVKREELNAKERAAAKEILEDE